jgi:DeoR family fructose operon transcriptional repressor
MREPDPPIRQASRGRPDQLVIELAWQAPAQLILTILLGTGCVMSAADADADRHSADSRGPGLFSDQRQEAIRAQINQDGRVSVAALAERFAVVGETIRRDLAELERRGVIRRVHGGAIPAQKVSFEPPIEDRATWMTAEKERIAAAALSEVPAGGSVFIEAGSTPSFLASILPADRALTIATNGGYIAHALARHENLTVLSVGGRVRPRSLACVDDWALNVLSRLHVDVAFLGTNGISVEGGLTTPDLAEAAVKRATLAIAARTVLLADHSKVGVVSLAQYGQLDQIDLLITDTGLAIEEMRELEESGLPVTRA